MNTTRRISAAILLGSLVLGPALAGAGSGPKQKSPISNPFHEYTGIPGLKLGYGDVLAQCQTYDNASNANPYAPFVTNVNIIANDNFNVGAGVNQGCRTPQNETTIAVNPANPNNLVAGANDYRDLLRQSRPVPCATTAAAGSTFRRMVARPGSNIKLPGLGNQRQPARCVQESDIGGRSGDCLRQEQHGVLRQHRLQSSRSIRCDLRQRVT